MAAGNNMRGIADALNAVTEGAVCLNSSSSHVIISDSKSSKTASNPAQDSIESRFEGPGDSASKFDTASLWNLGSEEKKEGKLEEIAEKEAEHEKEDKFAGMKEDRDDPYKAAAMGGSKGNDSYNSSKAGSGVGYDSGADGCGCGYSGGSVGVGGGGCGYNCK